MRKVYARRKKENSGTEIATRGAWKRKNSIFRDLVAGTRLGKYAEAPANFRMNGVSFYGRAT